MRISLNPGRVHRPVARRLLHEAVRWVAVDQLRGQYMITVMPIGQITSHTRARS